MLQLETKKKLEGIITACVGCGHQAKSALRAWRNREDPLTAAVFGIAAYLPFQSLLGPILRSAKSPARPEAFPNSITDDKVLSMELWPNINRPHEPRGPSCKMIPGKGKIEPDAVWRLKNCTVIIEVKRPLIWHTVGQINKYFTAVQKHQELIQNHNSDIWLLAVGKRSMPRDACAGLDLRENWHLLYIDWSVVLEVINKQVKDSTTIFVINALKDLAKVLQMRQLRTYTGMLWPNALPRLTIDKRVAHAIRNEWFHHGAHNGAKPSGKDNSTY